MNPSFEQVVTWIGMLIGLAGVWYRGQFKIERLEEKHIEQLRQIEALWKWKDVHERESATVRDTLNKDISELRGSLLVTGEQFKQILSMLQDIKERISELEKQK